jgi:hypothetical protein
MSTLLYTTMPQHTLNKAALAQCGVEDDVSWWVVDGGPEPVEKYNLTAQYQAPKDHGHKGEP